MTLHTAEKSGLKHASAVEKRNVESYLNAFAEIERALKRRLKRREHDKTGIARLIDEYVGANPFWAGDAAKLRRCAQIRNFLTHERSASEGYPVAVTKRSLVALEEMLNHLARPEPVTKRFQGKLITVGVEDSLADVLRQAYELEFSQFPVLHRGRFRGLLTENGITRWMGRNCRKSNVNLDLGAVTVKSVLEEEETEEGRRGQVFDFVRADAPVDEVIGMFASRPMLEAVLITESGGGGAAPLLGIVTEWDASRYTEAGDQQRQHIRSA